MPQERWGRSWAVVWGTLFLFAGFVILLQALNILPWALWGMLWKFWPAIIIIGGIVLLLGRRVWLVGLLTLALLGVCLWIAAGLYGPIAPAASPRLEERYSFLATGIDRTNLTLDFSAGRVAVGALDPGSNLLLQAEDTNNSSSTVRQERPRTMQAKMVQDGATASVTIWPFEQQKWGGWRVLWQVFLNRDRPVSIDARCDAASIDLDLRDVPAQIQRLHLNASSGRLTLPARGKYAVNVDMNMSNLDIVVPPGVAARIQPDVNLGLLSVDSARFPRQGNDYVSPDYESAANTVILHITCDVSIVRVK